MKPINVTVNEDQTKFIPEEDEDQGLTSQNDEQDVPYNMDNNLQSTEEDGDQMVMKIFLMKEKNQHQRSIRIIPLKLLQEIQMKEPSTKKIIG